MAGGGGARRESVRDKMRVHLSCQGQGGGTIEGWPLVRGK